MDEEIKTLEWKVELKALEKKSNELVIGLEQAETNFHFYKELSKKEGKSRYITNIRHFLGLSYVVFILGVVSATAILLSIWVLKIVPFGYWLPLMIIFVSMVLLGVTEEMNRKYPVSDEFILEKLKEERERIATYQVELEKTKEEKDRLENRTSANGKGIEESK